MKPTVLLFSCLAIIGAVLPLTQFIPWFLDHGLNVPLFLEELFSTRIGGFFGWDVIISAVVLICFIFIEGRRLAIRFLWVPVLCGLSIGVSFGLPVFLAMRESALKR